MARDRLEDLGRILTWIEHLLENPLFNEERMPSHHFWDWFKQQSESKQFEVITRFSYGIETTEQILIQLRDIAKGIDPLNEKSS